MGTHISGKQITNIRYAGDTFTLISAEDEMKAMMQMMETVSGSHGLRLNEKKFKKRLSIELTNTTEIGAFEVVDQFIYPCSLITNRGGSDAEIHSLQFECNRRMLRIPYIYPKIH